MILIELKTKPLGFLIVMPTGDGQTALRGFAPLTVAAAQGLVAALLGQPEVAGALTPEFLAALDETVAEHAEVQRNDADFLRAAGVAI